MKESTVAQHAELVQALLDLNKAESQGETRFNTSLILKALRMKDPTLREKLLSSRDYYRMVYSKGITDEFQCRLLEKEGLELETVGEFLNLWKGSLPESYEEVINDRDLVRLREAFDYINAERLDAVDVAKVNRAFQENLQFKAILSTSEGLKPLLFQFQTLEEMVGSRDGGKQVVFADFLWFCSLHLPHRKQKYTLGSVAEKLLSLPKKELNWGIPRCRAVTHAQIQQLAEVLGVNAQEEVKLLWVLKHALETPPPPTGGNAPEGSMGDGGESLGLEAAKRHVAYDYICDMLEYERQSSRMEDVGVDNHVWMKFEYAVGEESDRCVYYYNFATREISGEHPVKRNEKLMEDENGLIHAPLAKTFELNELRKRNVFGKGKRSSKGKGSAKGGNKQWSVLVFKAWWTEAVPTLTEKVSRRRYVEVGFHVKSGSCQLRIDGSASLFTLSHLNGRHEPIESWDLYVGRKVNLLGRQTTLMQADLSTQQWNYYYYEKFNAIRSRALAELSKYDINAIGAKFQRKLQVGNVVKSKTPPCDGSISLRAYIHDTHLLIGELEKYRPKVAKTLLRKLLSVMKQEDVNSPRLELEDRPVTVIES